MRIKFIQKIIDFIKQKKKFEELEQKYKKDLFDLYVTMNAKRGNEKVTFEDFNGIGIVDRGDEITNLIKVFFPNLDLYPYDENKLDISNHYFINSIGYSDKKYNILKKATYMNKPINILEMGFFYSADTWINYKVDRKYRTPVSYFLETASAYFDARFPSTLENMINDKNIIVTEEQKQRARKCIDKIVETHLTKYNHQPIFEPKIGRDGVKKILVVDQSYRDMSITQGWGSDATFEKMLQAAIDENPDADIIVKTHPDTMTGNRGGYYTGLKSHDNIYTMTEPINPISLIKYADKVYVCTTQFGFEALMCGKEVRVFGMPFYANWGLTQDEQICERRTNKRSLEEIFYLAYIEYSHYINPETKQRCEIEEAMDYLLKLREEYNELKQAEMLVAVEREREYKLKAKKRI